MQIIKAENLSKLFHIKTSGRFCALGQILDFLHFKNNSKKQLWALKDVNFEINSGETVGLIGNNGAGKSTLLRIISDIYGPTSGKITVNGNAISVINFYFSLNSRLSMRENILLSCSLYGLSSSNIKKQVDKVIEFAELEEFVNQPLYKLSNGMLQRLIFSIALYSINEADVNILLLDEVLAVGDNNFINKSIKKLTEIFGSKLTIIMASHNLNDIISWCQRTIWLDAGQLAMDGLTSEVLPAYKKTLKF